MKKNNRGDLCWRNYIRPQNWPFFKEFQCTPDNIHPLLKPPYLTDAKSSVLHLFLNYETPTCIITPTRLNFLEIKKKAQDCCSNFPSSHPFGYICLPYSHVPTAFPVSFSKVALGFNDLFIQSSQNGVGESHLISFPDQVGLGCHCAPGKH